MDIGIIGGADGPTAIFIYSGWGAIEAAAAVAIIVIAAGFIIRRIRKRNK